jgi:hypothetical protein
MIQFSSRIGFKLKELLVVAIAAVLSNILSRARKGANRFRLESPTEPRRLGKADIRPRLQRPLKSFWSKTCLFGVATLALSVSFGCSQSQPEASQEIVQLSHAPFSLERLQEMSIEERREFVETFPEEYQAVVEQGTPEQKAKLEQLLQARW